ncbi:MULTISPECIES: ArsR/SmtB family transcription factor [Heyndrickxia]|uniref:Metalloregulator ArsR/SmtB family transcription factor n=1 Tax=Heyndrickxia vini TaxID=1476025 RepID=A0ABX7E4N7_9BACI|nr:winged helix-turn-helix domain-containing protein [Heyndrickxia vini]QQZ10234.1 metalloregulator ArsR/SmtB family transcription factor [Heyndrickxia vini]
MGQGGENIIFISSPVFEQLSSMFVVQGDIQSSVGAANEVQKWVEERRRTIPQKLKNDLDVFFSKETFIGMSMIRYAYENNCYESVPNFIHQLESEEPYQLFMRFLQTGFTPDEVSNILDIQEVSHFIKQTNLPESEKWKLTYLYVDIENTKQRFVNLIKQYYEFYFKDDIPYFLKKQQESIADLYDKQQDLTRVQVGNIFPVIPSHVLENKEIKLILSPSFFYDTASLTSDSDDSFIYHFGMNEMKKNKMSQDDVLDAIKVVADEKRIKIIQLLNKSPRYGYELANTLNLSNSTVSHHLSTLSSIGIVYSTRIENKVYYQLHKEKLQVLMETLTKSLLD